MTEKLSERIRNGGYHPFCYYGGKITEDCDACMGEIHSIEQLERDAELGTLVRMMPKGEGLDHLPNGSWCVMFWDNKTDCWRGKVGLIETFKEPEEVLRRARRISP